jgi:ketosteroid isomerase-like protein
VSQTDAAVAANVAVVERWLGSFDRRWPSPQDLDELLAADIVFVERPNMLKPAGDERDGEGMRTGIEMGRKLMAWQTYEVRDHVADGDTVVTRMRWTGELAIDAGPWPAGTLLSAWCVAHYQLAGGRIVRVEQHDCYEQPVPPQTAS